MEKKVSGENYDTQVRPSGKTKSHPDHLLKAGFGFGWPYSDSIPCEVEEHIEQAEMAECCSLGSSTRKGSMF